MKPTSPSASGATRPTASKREAYTTYRAAADREDIAIAALTIN